MRCFGCAALTISREAIHFTTIVSEHIDCYPNIALVSNPSIGSLRKDWYAAQASSWKLRRHCLGILHKCSTRGILIHNNQLGHSISVGNEIGRKKKENKILHAIKHQNLRGKPKATIVLIRFHKREHLNPLYVFSTSLAPLYSHTLTQRSALLHTTQQQSPVAPYIGSLKPPSTNLPTTSLMMMINDINGLGWQTSTWSFKMMLVFVGLGWLIAL